MRDKTAKILLALHRISISKASTIDYELFREAPWEDVMNLASSQGVLAIAFDALEKLPSECRPGMDTLMDWLGQVSYMEELYNQHKAAIEELARFYDSNGIKMMLLKGYGLSKNYPKSNHRPVGDIDIYNFGSWQFADQMIHSQRGIEVDDSHEHHTVFTFKGISVENHYDFINTKSQKYNSKYEKYLREIVANEDMIPEKEIENLYYPSPQFNSLFLIRHAAGDFAASGMSLRQMLDWLLFVKKYHDQIDWVKAYGIYRIFNLNRFVTSLNAIGVKYLGFDASIFPEIETDDILFERILNDILSPEFTEKEDGTLLSGLWVKPRRWWHNRWKHAITSPDSMWSMFWYGLHAKLMKPAHFRH